uniref:CNH domain-containing protein n=1 Tax=Biomphalaria glabrata TaxID=6526 RepID=A0A2C9M943_BIOGL
MPHNAYEAIPILEKLPLTIESIACYESTLLVGTKQGVLLLYKVIKQKSRGTSGEVKYDVTLDRSNKSFAKKPITQLAAVPELFLLISLSDNVISVHDLTNFQQICCVQKTKGATLFAVDVQKRETHTGIDYYLRMGVASKRKIQLFYWENREFQELRQDLSLYDFPHALSWCQNSLCVGFKRDYFMINTKSGNLKELFPVGASQPDPLVTPLSDNRLALGRDAMSILINADGDPTQKEPITWSDIPIAMEHCPPYLIAILNKFVEVRTIDPKMMIQNISLPKARFICQGSGSIYAASPNNVWCLAPVPNSEQIRQLLTGKEFELALKLAELADEEPTEKQTRIQNIKNLYAFHLFCQMRFDESLTLFAKLGTDPSHVIGLYPNLLPEEFRKKLEYPDKVPDISGSNYEKGIMALIEYLTQKRNELNKEGYKETSTTAIVEGNKTITSRKQLSQIIDTTLLKCYLQTNDALVAPLLRLKDNNCHIEESERVLKKKEKFSELIILYEKKGLHQKALSTLMKQAARPESPLKGHERTVQYLQHLGKDHIDLIFEYAVWVLKQYPEDGLKIFTEDLPEIENLPRDQVLDFLEKVSPDLAIPYLIHTRDQRSLFENWFHEERAILLGRLGRHEQALGIYVYTLKDFQRAEDYCAKNYDSNKEGNKDVYYLLLKLILKATDGPQMNGPSGKQLESALKLLEDHAMKIDTAKALELLPSTTKLTDILAFLENVLEHQTAHRRSNQILKSILYAENLQVTEHLIHKQSVKIIVTEEDMCRSCKRRIGQSVFCRYSNGHLVHYSCYTKDLTSKN